MEGDDGKERGKIDHSLTGGGVGRRIRLHFADVDVPVFQRCLLCFMCVFERQDDSYGAPAATAATGVALLPAACRIFIISTEYDRCGLAE